ncbi:hypothetical protein [uncultured Metabacillus sp.]|nr:hypothetical protein [uncultured Metabacillus sp.]
MYLIEWYEDGELKSIVVEGWIERDCKVEELKEKKLDHKVTIL